MIKIGLLGHCHYTYTALSHMLNTMFNNNKDSVQIVRLDEPHANTLQQALKLDYLIVSGYQDMSFYSTLTCLREVFNHHPTRVIVMSAPPLTPLITHVFAQYCQQLYFIPLEASCSQIFNGMRRALLIRYKPNIQCSSIYGMLSTRERRILTKLCSGMRLPALCLELSLSEKVVSANKLIALEKLKIIRRDVFHHSLLRSVLCEPQKYFE